MFQVAPPSDLSELVGRAPPQHDFLLARPYTVLITVIAQLLHNIGHVRVWKAELAKLPVGRP